MDFAPDIVKGFEFLKDSAKIPAGAVENLFALILNTLLLGPTPEDQDIDSPKFSSARGGALADPVTFKLVYASLASLATIAAKNNLDAPQLVIESLANAYDSSRAALRVMLMKSGTHHPHIVDVKWRVDYLVKSDALEKCNAPIFYVTFKVITSDPTKPEDVSFTASLEQMQDLVAKLKDATGSLSRLDVFA